MELYRPLDLIYKAMEEKSFKSCDMCKKWGTTECPHSKLCYSTESKLFFEQKEIPQSVIDKFVDDVHKIINRITYRR